MINKSGEIVKVLADLTKLQSVELPSSIGIENKIVPVLAVNPFVADVTHFSNKDTTGTGTAMTTDSDRDFYITGFVFNAVIDATCDAADVVILWTYRGKTQYIKYYLPSLTASIITQNLSFNYPIKVDRSSTVGTYTTYANGTMKRAITIMGFYL